MATFADWRLYVALLFVPMIGGAVGSGAGAAAEQLAGIENARQLRGMEIVELISENSISGVRKGKHFVEYYDPRGLILGAAKGKSDEGGYTGTWTIKGNKLCVLYMEFIGSDGCWNLAQDGKRIYLYDRDGRLLNANNPALVLPGKANDL